MTRNVNATMAASPRFLVRSDLRAEGMGRRQVEAAIRSGTLRRIRKGVYGREGSSDDCLAAVGVRGRLTCVTELRRRGIFVLDKPDLHVHIDDRLSRLPSIPAGWRVHRRRLRRNPHPRAMSVETFDALLHAVLCQSPRVAVATLDSALHLGSLRDDELDEFFAALPRRYRRLRGLLDGRAESGPETLVRLMLRALGCSFELQVLIHGVGRVDVVVDGWLIVEYDSREFHSDWASQKDDRRRDLAAATLGYCTVRVVAEDIMWRPEIVLAALKGLVDGRPRGTFAG